MIPKIDESSIFVAKRSSSLVNGKRVFTYSPPVSFSGVISPLEADRSIQMFGEQSGNNYNLTSDLRYSDKLFVGDRVWIEVSIPTTHDLLASTADYVVDSQFVHRNIQTSILRKIL